jgi:hypothetical protein
MASGIRIVAIALSALVAAGFLGFAADQMSDASAKQQTVLADPEPGQERARERGHGDARELVDDANDGLLKPFASVTDGSSSDWVRRGVPTLLALAIYGLGLGFLARWVDSRA